MSDQNKRYWWLIDLIKKNGFTRHGKQNHRCLDCGRQFSSELEMETFPKVNHTIFTTIHESKVIEITVPYGGS